MNKPNLSVALITLNEVSVLERTLQAVVEIADEIIVVDSGSKDGTIELAKRYDAKVFEEPWKGFSAQKNSALEKCSGRWILSLDADEVVTGPLAKEILSVVKHDARLNGFRIARLFYLGERVVRYGGYYPDYQLRLIRNGLDIQFGKRSVHESIRLDEPVGTFKNPLKHFAYKDLKEYKIALDKYAKLAREEVRAKRLHAPVVRASWAFLFRYFFKGGFLEGRLGLQMAIAYFRYVREKYERNR